MSYIIGGEFNVKQCVISTILAILLIVVCIHPCVLTFATETKKNAVIMSQNAGTTNCSLTISGVKATVIATVKTEKVMSLSIKLELQKLKSGTYTTVETWTESKSAALLQMEKFRLINALSTYRLKATFKMGSETIIRYAYS